ncbi:MAG TPA: Uma2 family endonuclease [Pyrinomonadaceae bacterium]|nr:Uma2 family endonuclease [Pyrinomonadaceae bacterium]
MSAVLEVQKSVPKTEVYQNGQVLRARLISVEEYDRMIEHGILTEEDKVELLNGVIIEKMPKGTKHSSANDRLTRLFYKLLDDKVIVRNQNPIWLDEFSEPEPDIALVVPDKNFYADRHPTPEDIFLIVEISDTTLGRDRLAKGLAYAKAGIRQYLVLNVQEETVEDYREPSADGFGSKRTFHKGESFSLTAFPEIEIKVDESF